MRSHPKVMNQRTRYICCFYISACEGSKREKGFLNKLKLYPGFIRTESHNAGPHLQRHDLNNTDSHSEPPWRSLSIFIKVIQDRKATRPETMKNNLFIMPDEVPRTTTAVTNT